MGVGCVGTTCVGDGTREVRALGCAEGAHRLVHKARAASTLGTGVLRMSRIPGRRVQGAHEGIGARYGSACVGAARVDCARGMGQAS